MPTLRRLLVPALVLVLLHGVPAPAQGAPRLGAISFATSAGPAAQRAFVASTLGKLKPDDLAELDRLVLLWRDLARAVDAE